MFLDQFRRQVEQQPNKIAIHIDSIALSYQQLGEAVDAMAGRLLAEGVRHGTHVAVLLDNDFSYPAVLLAALQVGAVLVPFSPKLSAEQLRIGLERTDARVALTSGDQPALIRALSECAPGRQVINLHEPVPGAKGPTERTQPQPTGESDPYIIVSTSGSTSEPKPIVLTQGVGLRRIGHTIATYNLTTNDVLIVATPLYHSLAQRFAILALTLGATLVLLERFRPQPYLEAIEAHRVTFAMAVSNQIEAMIPSLSESDLSSLRTLISSSYSIKPESKRILLSAISADVYECYGTSEIGCATNLNLRMAPDKAESVGAPLPYVKIRILNEESQPTDGVGQIAVRTETAFAGYYKQPDTTRNSYCDGFFLTGDLGSLDADGYLYYSGRCKELIKTSGISVYPIDIERVINELDGVRECAVVGVPDDHFGEMVVAVVVGAVTPAAVQTRCRARLAPYQQPLHVELQEELPKTALGKVQKFVLQQQLAERRLGERFRGMFS